MTRDTKPVNVQKLRELFDDGTPAPWQEDNLGEKSGFRRVYIEDSKSGSGMTVAQWVLPRDAALIVEVINALPALLAVYEAAQKVQRGCDCEYDYRCGRCQAVLDLVDALRSQ